MSIDENLGVGTKTSILSKLSTYINSCFEEAAKEMLRYSGIPTPKKEYTPQELAVMHKNYTLLLHQIITRKSANMAQAREYAEILNLDFSEDIKQSPYFNYDSSSKISKMQKDMLILSKQSKKVEKILSKPTPTLRIKSSDSTPDEKLYYVNLF
ncbi:MAG: hypothetical protein AB7V77_03255 [Candidatus Woesearchaeota archaeon]